MTNKSFFKQRTKGKIKELSPRRVYNQHNLVEKIYEMDGNSQAIILNTQLVPGQYHRGTKYQAEASRKCFKHGRKYVTMSHPQTRKECYESPDIPLALRKKALSRLEDLSEDQIFSQGISFKPHWSKDQSERRVPYIFAAEALRLFAYAENSTEPIETKIYDKAKKAKREGASVLVKVPSRRQGIPQYLYRLIHVPVTRNQNNLATVLTLKPSMLQEDGRPVSQRVPHDVATFGYTRESDQESSDAITFYPHDIAAYIAIIRDCNKNHNLTPLEMNPFPIFSRSLMEDFYKKLENNVLVFDPTIIQKDHLRRLHLAEKNILLARAIRTLGHDETTFWDPARDGKLKDYDWGVN